MTPNCDNNDVWRSLFLPLEDVIFTSFITLLSPCRLAKVSDDENSRDHHSSASDPGAATVERSPLFALCGERADTMVCVLANRDVCFVDMTDAHAGPTEVRRLHGTKSPRGNRSSTATCASLIPLEIGHACRLPVAAMPLSPSSSAGHLPAGASAHAEAERTKTLFLRGVVGSSDGRVDVFSEHGYVFGFVAHDSPVTAVSAIYGVSDDAASAPDHSPPAAQQSGASRNFDSATANLGFITCGTDGVVLVWRRENLALRPRAIARGSFFSRAVAWCAVQPSSRDWLLSGMGAPRSSLFIHTTPYAPCELRMRGVAALDDVGPRVPLPGASLFSRTAAIASNGEIALIARGRKVYRVTLAEARCDFVVATPSPVALMQLTRSGVAVAVAACAKSNADVFVLDARRGALLGTYATGLPGPARCIALHSGARLCAVVSARGAVKVAVMPDAYAEHIEADEEVAEAIPAARTLQCLAKLQRETPDGRASVEEALVMSRMSVPGEVNNYLHRTAGVW